VGLAAGKVGVAIWAAAALLMALVLLTVAAAAISSTTVIGGGASAAGCHLSGQADLDPEQATNAAIIIQVGQQMQVPQRGWVIAVATAMQESGLRNLPDLGEDNDHDSLGLFQQRPSMGWGTPEQIGDPRYAATVFYERLVQEPGWESMPLTEAAQAVQRSAFPDAYAKHEPTAQRIVDAYLGGVSLHQGRLECRPVTSDDGWAAPIVGGEVTSGFRTSQRPDHHGVDIAAPHGTPVFAAAAGRVGTIVCQAALQGIDIGCDRDGSPEVSGCGWYIEILHSAEDPMGGDETMTRYCHLLRRPDLEVGQDVQAGQPIGLVGSSGSSSGPHLHFEVHHRLDTDLGHLSIREPVDPVLFLAQRGIGMQSPKVRI
jgi:murein DD-endopeptidase MepM/ murein hydrolase activator NlpD